MRTKLLLAVGIGLMAAAAPILAHHALAAEYDTKQSVMMKGTVTKIVWNNPHVHLYLHAMDGTPDSTWDFELGSPNLLTLSGFKIDTFRRGDYVLVTAYPARDGSKLGYANKVALAAH